MSAIVSRGSKAACLSGAQQARSDKKHISALSKQVEQADAARVSAELARDKAERALRDMDRQFAATRARLGRAEALLRSHGIAPPDA